jgi:hypothetical protein
MDKQKPFTVGNAKLGKSIKTWQRPYRVTCSKKCPLLDNGCYADPNTRGMFMQAGNKGAIARYGQLPRLSRLKSGTVVRLHVVGDFGREDDSADTDYIDGVQAEAEASDCTTYTYTHGWRKSDWGADLLDLRQAIRINASCDTLQDVAEAHADGWRIAYHGTDVSLNETYHETPQGRLLVCPAQRRDEISCETCKACWSDTPRYIGVAFADH